MSTLRSAIGGERYCSACERTRKNNDLKKLYGITLDDYDRLSAAQGHRCAICGCKQKSNKRLNVDHDHSTGKMRGLLCGQCNRALGGFKDDKRLLQRAKDYLNKHA